MAEVANGRAQVLVEGDSMQDHASGFRGQGLERVSDPEDLVRALRVSGAPDLGSAARTILDALTHPER